VWETLQHKVYKTHVTDLDELKERLRMKWAKLDHDVIAASVASSPISVHIQVALNTGGLGLHFEHRLRLLPLVFAIFV